MMRKYFITCYDEEGEMSKFEVPKPVYDYIKEMTNHINYQGRNSKLLEKYKDRFYSYAQRETDD